MTDTFWSGYGNALGAIGNVGGQIANRRAGARLGAGDYKGAAGALFDAGELAGGLRVQGAGQAQEATQQAATQERQIAFTRQAVKALRESQNPLVDFDAMAPAFRQLGTGDAEIGQLRQGLETGGRQFLDQIDQIANEQERQLSFQKAGDTLYVFEDGNPNPVNTFEPAQRPLEVGGVLVDPVTYEPILDTREPKYQTVQNSDGSSEVVAIDQPAPVSRRPARGGADAVAVIQDVLPGVSFNSGLRTPEQNRSAGGAQNSYHLRGQAVDIPRQPGQTIQQLRAQLEARGVTVKEALDEGDHWHIAWEGGPTAANYGRGEAPRSGGVRTVAQGRDLGPTAAQRRVESNQAEQNSRADNREVSALRREMNARNEVKQFTDVDTAFNNIQSAVQSPSAAGDLNLIFSYMKVLDPTSTVREGEFANAQNAGSAFDRVGNLYNRVASGERLNANQRQDFLQQARNLREARRPGYDRVRAEYEDEARLLGFDPARLGHQNSSQAGAQSGLVRAPGLRFPITSSQMTVRQQVVGGGGRPSQDLGGQSNPYYINPSDGTGSYANIPAGGWYVDPQGTLRQKRSR